MVGRRTRVMDPPGSNGPIRRPAGRPEDGCEPALARAGRPRKPCPSWGADCPREVFSLSSEVLPPPPPVNTYPSQVGCSLRPERGGRDRLGTALASLGVASTQVMAASTTHCMIPGLLDTAHPQIRQEDGLQIWRATAFLWCCRTVCRLSGFPGACRTCGLASAAIAVEPDWWRASVEVRGCGATRSGGLHAPPGAQHDSDFGAMEHRFSWRCKSFLPTVECRASAR